MEIYLDPEEQIICPYNNSHYIRRKRMNTHLTKCKQSHPEVVLVECDFNVNHKIPEPELQWHHDHCPDRHKIEITVYQDNKTDLNKFPVHNVHVPTDESWDNDNVATYDPQKYCENKEIIRHKDVASAAQRRNFRMEERARISQVLEKEKGYARNDPPCSVRASKDNIENQNRRELPETRRKDIPDEETPNNIAEIVQRIRIGANQSYIPK